MYLYFILHCVGPMFCLYFYHVIYLCSVCGVIPLPKQAMMSSSGAPAHADGPETHISDT